MEISNAKENRDEGEIQQREVAELLALDELPEGCIANIVSFTSPKDACRLSVICPIFRSATGSDAVWETFLPPDIQAVISESPDSSSLTFPSKKELFFSLCNTPILIDGGKKSFSLDIRSGKKRIMIAARDLMIVWGDTPDYWVWIPCLESRFPEVAQLEAVWWLEICGKISASRLSPATNYAAYIVFKLKEGGYGFENLAIDGSVSIAGEAESKTKMIFMVKTESKEEFGKYAKERDDGWLENELGEFFNGNGDDEIEMVVKEVDGYLKGGLIVQGIEIRPKEAQ